MRFPIGIIPTMVASLALTANAARAQEAETFEPDEAAASALEKVVQSYRNQPGIRVKSWLKIELTQGETTSEGDEVEIELLHLKNGNGLVRIRGFTCYINDENLYAIHKDVEHSYFSEPLDGAPYWLFLDAFRDLPYPHLAILWGDPEPEFLWWELHTGTPEFVPVAVENIEVAAQENAPAKNLQQITLRGPAGSMIMRVDPKTKLIDSIEHKMTGGELIQPGAVQTTRYRFEYKVYKEPPDPKEYIFAPMGRQRVDMLTTLMPRPEPVAPAGGAGGEMARGGEALVGKLAPPFTLATADGDAVDLEELRGQVVVLDFWATWCGPCRGALPGLHEVDRWVQKQALPVKILTVNVWEGRGEEGSGPQGRLQAVIEFWQANKFTLPVAMDYTDEIAVAYRVAGIPTTVIIRSDGTVHAVHVGAADPEALKQEINAALQALEAGDDESKPQSSKEPPAG